MTPNNPQQNGEVERKNRSIVGEVEAMFHDQGLLMFLWAEACNTLVFLQNKSPHVMFLFLVSLIAWSIWTSMVGGS